MTLRVSLVLAAAVLVGLPCLGRPVLAQAPATPVPRPFPGTGPASAPPARPAAPAPAQTASAPEPTVAASVVGGPDIGDIPIYPTATYLDSFDAGQGQQYLLYGTNTGYETVMQYYRTVLRNGGREIYEQPAIRQWDLGRFRDDRMAFPPSIVVKDYAWNDSPGYLYVSDTTETRYKTIIQVVPPDPSER